MFQTIQLSEINFWAVLVSGIVNIVACLILYLPKLFGNAWVKLTGKDMNPARQWIPAGIFGHLLNTFVLAVLLNVFNATSMYQGIGISLLACIGFMIPLLSGELVWEKIPFKLFMIRSGVLLITQCLSGVILTAWR